MDQYHLVCSAKIAAQKVDKIILYEENDISHLFQWSTRCFWAPDGHRQCVPVHRGNCTIVDDLACEVHRGAH